jgi:hypothetical protein
MNRPMSRGGNVAAIIVSWSLAAIGVGVLALPAAISFPVVFVFVLLIPGLALVTRLRLGSIPLELLLAIAVSLALAATVAELLLYTELYSATRVTVILAVLAIGTALRTPAPATHPVP